MTRARLVVAGLLLCAAATAQAATTDIRTVRTIVTRAASPTTCSGDRPEQGRLVCVQVVVQNLGPDTYVGTDPNKANAAAGRLKISVDIDEPTKPGGTPRTAVSFERDFAVTIAPGDSVALDFGVVGYKPPFAGTNHVRSTATAQLPNIDPNPANDSAFDIFIVLARVPGPGFVAAGLLAVVLAVVALRRRRAAAGALAREDRI